MTRRALVGLALVAALLGVGPARIAPQPARAVGTDLVLYIAGDSTAATVYLPTGDTFRDRLASRLPDGTTVISVACSGQRLLAGTQATSVSGCTDGQQPSLVSQWPLILAATPKPTVILLGPFGINDMGRVDDATWQTAYLSLLSQATAAGIRVVTSTMNPVNTDWVNYNTSYVPGYSVPSVARYWMNKWLVSRFSTEGMARPDLALANSDGTLSRWYQWCNSCPYGQPGDGIHPGAFGVLRMAGAVPVDRIV